MPVLAIDAGATVCKAAVFDGRRLLSYACRHHGYHCPADGRAEQDPTEIWGLIDSLAREAVADSRAGQRVAAVCISVQGDAMIPVDSAGMPLHPAILGMDSRSYREASDFESRFGRGYLYSATGMPCQPLNFITKVLWFERSFPDLRPRVWKYLHFGDFLAYRIARVPALDFSMASRSMAFDPVRKDWVGEILNFAGIAPSHLGNVTPSGVPVGIVSSEVAEAWGINRGAMLVAGSHNQCAAAIGAGVVEPHLACYSIGSSEVIGTCLPAARPSPGLLEGNFPCYCHAVQDQYFTITLNQSGGLSLEWFYDAVLQHGQQEPEVASPLRPSPVLFLPHLVGSGTPTCDHLSRGAFVGLSLKTRRADLLQAIADAQAFEARFNLETLEHSGVGVAELRAVDRGARRRAELQIRATVLNRPIHTLQCPEAALLGAAMLAETAIGTFADLEEACAECVRVASTVVPLESARPAYNEAYDRFRNLYAALRSFYRHWQSTPERVLPTYSHG